MPIAWNNHYTVDGGGIDDDHRHLMRLYNRLEQDVVARPAALSATADLPDSVEAFRSACIQHFRRKQRLQHLIRFPRAEDHRAHHANLLERLDSILGALSGDGSQDDSAAAGSALFDLRLWLVDHILKYDVALKPFAAVLREITDEI